jgi:hypothetical protein
VGAWNGRPNLEVRRLEPLPDDTRVLVGPSGGAVSGTDPSPPPLPPPVAVPSTAPADPSPNRPTAAGDDSSGRKRALGRLISSLRR